MQSFTNINLCFRIGVGAGCIIDEDGALAIFLVMAIIVPISIAAYCGRGGQGNFPERNFYIRMQGPVDIDFFRVRGNRIGGNFNLFICSSMAVAITIRF